MLLSKGPLAILTVALAVSTAAHAGTATYTAAEGKKAVQPVECPPDTLTSFSASSDYGFHDKIKDAPGNLEAAHQDIEFDQRIPLDFTTWPNVECGHWYLRLGAEYERFDFSVHNQGRLPGTLQSASGIVALEYVVKDEVAFLIETDPGVYFERKINFGAFDAPITIAGAYPIFGGDKFYLALGVRLSLLNEYPVLPIGGIIWHINDKWDLRGVMPDPRLVYIASPNLELFVGGELVGNAYKTDNRPVDPHRLSGAVVTYDDVRVGAGFTWKTKPLTLELAGGYSLEKEFSYDRADQHIKTDPAPYIRLSAELDF